MNPHQERPIQLFPDGVRCLILVDDFQQSQHTGCASNESGNDCAKNAVCFLLYFDDFRFFFHAASFLFWVQVVHKCSQRKSPSNRLLFSLGSSASMMMSMFASGFSGSFEESVFPHAAPEVFSLGRLADDDVIQNINSDNFACVDQHIGR